MLSAAMQRGGPTAQVSMLAAQQGAVWEWQYPHFSGLLALSSRSLHVLWRQGFQLPWLWSLTVSVPPRFEVSRRL